jgi:hypothetical protein
MKFCIDCKHYRAEIVVTGGAWFPGALNRIPATCLHPVDPDVVSGQNQYQVLDAKAARADEDLCGADGKWFDPATLDGRLAMLPDAKEQA